MKHYLDLVSLSAKVHRKQSRMSVICIILSVFMVAVIFGMADMFIQSQLLQAVKDGGAWHLSIKDISEEDAALLAARPDVEVVSPYAVVNFHLEWGYQMGGKDVLIFGCDENCLTKIFPDKVLEGTFPQSKGSAVVTANAKERMGLSIGDTVSVQFSGDYEQTYQVTGVSGNAPGMMSYDAYGIFLPVEDYCTLYPVITDGMPVEENLSYLVQFSHTGHIQQKIQEIKEVFHLTEDQVAENTKLLGLLGQSRDSFMMSIYVAAGILAVLVLVAGILMIASSLNSNVAQRTEFFGLMRCIGATPKQVMRLVRKEALGWCRFAIPAGVAIGIVVIWVLCAILRYLSPEYFAEMPAFGVSIPSIAASILVGWLTVMLAARSPAKKAAKVSPLAAVSGHTGEQQPVRPAADTRRIKVDTALGIHHAVSSRKNYLLMTGSFAISIILFLSFSVTIDFMHHALTPLQPWTADISIVSPDQTCSVDHTLLDRLQENPAVKAVYGRMFSYHLPVMQSSSVQAVDLISYEEKQFAWAKEYLLEGSLETVQQEIGTGLMVYTPGSTVQVGDTFLVQINGQSQEIRIAGILSSCPFDASSGTRIVICSEDSFRQFTGLSDYTIIDVQLTKGVSDAEVTAIHQMVGTTYLTFSDQRLDNSSTRGVYYCFNLFVYGFLIAIVLITIFNVINSIDMSVAARMKQYGVFRAIGLSTQQLSKMVVAEASSYAVSGSIVGTAFGLPVNRLLFGFLVSSRWGELWKIPWVELGIILMILLFSVALAVYGPMKKIRNMSIVHTITAQ